MTHDHTEANSVTLTNFFIPGLRFRIFEKFWPKFITKFSKFPTILIIGQYYAGKPNEVL
jgi:hypothetical protein